MLRVLTKLNNSLSKRSHAVLKMRWIEGRTIEEIAKELGLTELEVRLRQDRSMRRFRDMVRLALEPHSCTEDLRTTETKLDKDASSGLGRGDYSD